MNITETRVRTRTTHSVVLRIEDGPIFEAVRGRDGYHRHQVTRLSISYTDGELDEVRTDGPRLNADGQRHGRGDSAYIDWLPWTYRAGEKQPTDGLLRADTPEWIRAALDAHPWPATAEIVAEWNVPQTVTPDHVAALNKAGDQFQAWADQVREHDDEDQATDYEVTVAWLRQWAGQPLDADWSTPEDDGPKPWVAPPGTPIVAL